MFQNEYRQANKNSKFLAEFGITKDINPQLLEVRETL